MDFWRMPIAELGEVDDGPAPAPAAAAGEPTGGDAKPAEVVELGPAGLYRSIQQGIGGTVLKDPPSGTDGDAIDSSRKAGKDGDRRKGGKGGGKKDGWLPKAEYEAKKREERTRRDPVQDKDGDAKGNRRGRKGKGWVDIPVDMPKRPDPGEAARPDPAKLELEERKLKVRDQLRSASTAEDMRDAIAAAKALGLTTEVQVGERKLEKMTST
mmetsp:Transcript_63199/g.150708  ORF Transcript_63199/g.150708 Transcript_63199/m.150708 type:complete len:212 (+) Transcript_63199:149-784(+)|eukprot:CAMPEP_0178468678 /NCGR_PEP_ID=MMETSP0689_2-20121128/53041_1 /TAXON_ID=160604 /ORGANISM="Amphidinium massartii, Strain CS-259" /LENGTH=211 /DNA_ID=CAMNT_0020095737 /DNA_START=62 /DNA_END=697 /DNA_ORIENTATION=-